LTALKPEDVIEKITFARRRLDDILGLISRTELASRNLERQQYIQEFFFHLIGAVDLAAQLVNDRLGLGIDSEDVTIRRVADALQKGSPLEVALHSSYVLVRGHRLPTDPYSDEGYLFRAYNYRHQVTHRRRNPFTFRVGSSPPASFTLDPRDSASVIID
jgi:hypothetical protein